MNRKLISYLLKAVVILLLLGLLFSGSVMLPAYLRFFERDAPGLSGILAQALLIYINLSFVPVYICLLMAWRTFTTIESDTAFCFQNAKRLQIASYLALVDTGMVIALCLFLWISFHNFLLPLFFFLSVVLLVIGISAAIICFALSKLVQQAAELKQELDLTI